MLYAILPVSLVLAAACAVINLWLGFRIGQVRRRERIFIGDGGSDPLIRRMRAQANFLESAPFVMVLVALIEAATGQDTPLWIAAGVFVAARIAHPFGMDGRAAARMAGAIGTALVLLLLALWAVAIPIVAASHVERGERASALTPVA